jgi:hypothetical protein
MPVFQRLKNANIKWLKKMSTVWRKLKRYDLVLPTVKKKVF